MATTTNYSWSTPDDTALVKDGAAAIRTLGSSADTTVKALNPGTTAGDIDYYTTSTAKARVAIGTAGQVLTVNSGATAPEWTTVSTGGMTSLASGSLSGSSVTLSSISGSYTNLYLAIKGVSATSTADQLRIRFNGETTNYGSTAGSGTSALNMGANDFAVTNAATAYNIQFFNYAAAGGYKVIQYNNCGFDGSNTWTQTGVGTSFNTTAAITSITILTNSGNTWDAGTYVLYGVK
jgi:hypothetical protein